MWHVSFRSGVVTLRTAIHLLLVTVVKCLSRLVSHTPIQRRFVPATSSTCLWVVSRWQSCARPGLMLVTNDYGKRSQLQLLIMTHTRTRLTALCPGLPG